VIILPHRRAIGRALLLVPVVLLLPTLAWSGAVAMVHARNPNDFSWAPPPGWIRSPLLDVAAHPGSLLVIGAYGTGVLVVAIRRIKRRTDWTPERTCRHCGYSRSGLRGVRCPECGLTPSGG
jgi:hypothetical protein